MQSAKLLRNLQKINLFEQYHPLMLERKDVLLKADLPDGEQKDINLLFFVLFAFEFLLSGLGTCFG